MDLKERIEKSFSTYAAMTIQHRAIVDARDFCKPAARMAFYSQYIDGLTYPKPHRKTHKSIVSAMDHFYVHGDASMLDLLAHQARKITMRYPIEDAIGNMGTYTFLNNCAAPRYTEMRLGELGVAMLDGIKKDCIERWFDNYDNTDKFPSVLPSLGFYNIVNGTVGIATGLSASIPQFNIKEVNEALIKLLWNPEISFDEIYCAPDFATGGTIINGKEVKASLKNGRGKSCIIRGSVEYDSDTNTLKITEVPYNVATSNIKKQVGAMFEDGTANGIQRFEDSSEDIVDITVWLNKGANPSKVTKNLFKKTMLQYHFPINMTMLDNGTYPKVFGWKEALNAHLDHEKEVRRKIYEFDLDKINARIHIIDGFLIAIANIEEVVKIIKSSKNKIEAKRNLCYRYGFDDEQVEAILKLTLNRLCSLEIQSFNDEKTKLTNEKERIEKILATKELFYKEIEKDLRRIADKFGDERRTRIIDLDFTSEEEDAEPVEKKELLIHFTNLGNIYTQESTTLLTTRRGTKGTKIKMANNEVVIDTLSDDNFSSLLVFTNKGQMYSMLTDNLPVNSKVNVNQLFEFEEGETITAATTTLRKKKSKYIIFVTKNGMIKKSLASEYEHKRGKSLKAINLKDDDEVLNVFFTESDNVGLLSSVGNFINISTKEISAIGRASAGVKAMNLKDGETIIAAKPIKSSDKYLCSVSKEGIIKKAPIEDFSESGRATRGRKISEVKNGDSIVDFLTFEKDCDIIINTKRKTIKISTEELRTLSRDATGVKLTEIADNDSVIKILA